MGMLLTMAGANDSVNIVSPSANGVNLPEGFEIVQLTDGGGQYYTGSADINNCGEIVWSRRLESAGRPSSEVYLYDNGKVTRLTDNDNNDGRCRKYCQFHSETPNT